MIDVPKPAASATATDPSKRHRSTRSMVGVPLIALFLGVPVWWVLGLFQAVFFVAAALMAAQLMRRRTIQVPKGFGVWMLFLVWLLGGLFVLQIDAPGAIPGQSSGRYLTFGYRFGWYLICTIVALYVINTRRTLSSDRVCAAISWFFVMLVGGGLLAVLRPQLTFPSALELALPNRLTRQKFVSELIHPNVAQIHDFLGSEGARPSAPFAYTNDWGMAIAVALPFFVMVWWRRRGFWRWAMFGILAAAMIPIIASLNRGLWVSIMAIVLFTAIRSALSGRIRLLAGFVALTLAVGLVVIMSPLGAVIQARIETPHSDEGRTNLSTQSVTSAVEGSPIIGFGSTRDVAGNFASIAGGATDECPKCAPPPLGTHGQAWLLIFASGLGGFLLFTAFLVGQFVRNLRSPSATASAPLACLLVLLLTMPIYNSVGIPLFIGFISVGLLARETAHRSPESSTLLRLAGPVRRGVGVVILMTLLGGLVGMSLHQIVGQPARATQAVLVPAIDLTGLPEARTLTLDSEALMVRSGPVLEAVGEVVGNDDLDTVSNQLVIGAEPNTRVLTITYVHQDAVTAAAAVDAAVDAYLAERAALHLRARESQSEGLVARHDTLNETFQMVETIAGQVDAANSRTVLSTLGWLQAGMTDTLTNMYIGSTNVGHPVTDVTVAHSTDLLLVRSGSGVTLGAVVGLILARGLGGRLGRIRAPRRGDEILGLPVVLKSASACENGNRDQRPNRALYAYRPLCGLLADPGSPPAVAFAKRHDSDLGRGADRRSKRALLVLSESSRIHSALRLRSRCIAMGVDPVGVIVVSHQTQEEGDPSA